MVPLNISLPKGFLEEEERNGIVVSKKLKEIWAVELDLFFEFDRVCKKYNICYVASGGTLLGAIRHKGFIPWDDDMDLMMLRSEYERFCEIAPQEFKYPYFFQTESTDHGFRRRFARIRNSKTTGILKKDIKWKYTYNQGIFIDIFPLDNVVDDKNLYHDQCKTYQLLNNLCLFLRTTEEFPSIYKKYSFKYWSKLAEHYTIGYISRHFQWSKKAYNKSECICKQYNDTTSEFVSLLSFQIDELRHAVRRKSLDNIIYTDFEFLKIPIFADYKEHLKRKYGDYMIMRHDSNLHGEVIFDTDVSYKEYLEKQI